MIAMALRARRVRSTSPASESATRVIVATDTLSDLRQEWLIAVFPRHVGPRVARRALERAMRSVIEHRMRLPDRCHERLLDLERPERFEYPQLARRPLSRHGTPRSLFGPRVASPRVEPSHRAPRRREVWPRSRPSRRQPARSPASFAKRACPGIVRGGTNCLSKSGSALTALSRVKLPELAQKFLHRNPVPRLRRRKLVVEREGMTRSTVVLINDRQHVRTGSAGFSRIRCAMVGRSRAFSRIRLMA